MKGYFSFLLVLSILVCIFAFLSPLPQLHSESDYAAIEAERTNSVSMNVKEVLILSTSYNLRAAAEAYDLTHPEENNPVERELAIKAGILSGWVLLSQHQFDQDFDVEFWCGYINKGTKEELSEEMVKEGKVLSCPGCTGTFPLDCVSFLQLDQKELPEEKDRVRLAGPAPPPAFFGAVGASIYSPGYKTANVVYVPLSEWIE
ncbi:hypothetical protein GF415_04765 [Candidatus Micrarchaeota archaeon]|nr:hypothetical protein [Candidatus Micrarchaeota archaeon]